MIDPQPTFEEALAELEQIVARLEGGNLALEEMLTLYERGQALAALCEELLNQAQIRLDVLRKNPDGSTTLTPLGNDVEE